MSEENGSKLGVITAVIGAVGAVAAAVLPVVFNRSPSGPDPADTKPVAAAGASLQPDAKQAGDAGRKTGGKQDSKGAGSAGHTSKGTDHSLPSELSRFQGTWSVVKHTIGDKDLTKDDITIAKLSWEFNGKSMIILSHGKAPGLRYQGTISLHPEHSPKMFEITGKNDKGQAFESLGIYTFEGAILVLRYQFHLTGRGDRPARPKSFKAELRPGSGTLVRLRRAKR